MLGFQLQSILLAWNIKKFSVWLTVSKVAVGGGGGEGVMHNRRHLKFLFFNPIHNVPPADFRLAVLKPFAVGILQLYRASFEIVFSLQ